MHSGISIWGLIQEAVSRIAIEGLVHIRCKCNVMIERRRETVSGHLWVAQSSTFMSVAVFRGRVVR